MDTDPEETVNFIEAVWDIPALWNKASKEFKEGKRKPQMWADLAQEHGFEDGEQAKKRWGYLRDYYVKTKNKQVASGSAAVDESPSFDTQSAAARSQADVIEYDDDDEESLNSSMMDERATKDEQRISGGPTPKRIKQERLFLEKRFLGVMESTAQQLQVASSTEESAEELFCKSIGMKLTELKSTNPAGVEWAMLEIQRIVYQVKCPPPQQMAPVELFNYVTGQGL